MSGLNPNAPAFVPKITVAHADPAPKMLAAVVPPTPAEIVAQHVDVERPKKSASPPKQQNDDWDAEAVEKREIDQYDEEDGELDEDVEEDKEEVAKKKAVKSRPIASSGPVKDHVNVIFIGHVGRVVRLTNVVHRPSTRWETSATCSIPGVCLSAYTKHQGNKREGAPAVMGVPSWTCFAHLARCFA